MCFFRKRKVEAPIEESFKIYGILEQTSEEILSKYAIFPEREHMCQPLCFERVMEDRKLYTDKECNDFYVYDVHVEDYILNQDDHSITPLIPGYHDIAIHNLRLTGESSIDVYPNCRLWIVRFVGEKFAFQVYAQDWFNLCPELESRIRSLDTLCFNEWYKNPPKIVPIEK